MTQAAKAIIKLEKHPTNFWGDVLTKTEDGALFFGDSWFNPTGKIQFEDGSSIVWETNYSLAEPTNPEIKSSYDWMQTYNEFIVVDPDGWDRSNLDFSLSELITEEEFFTRRTLSSVIKRD